MPTADGQCTIEIDILDQSGVSSMYDFYAAAVAVQWICVMDDSQGTAFLSGKTS